MPMSDKEREALDNEIYESVGLGLKHLNGAESHLISGNADLILDCVFQLMLQEKITFEEASHAFVLKALKYQKSRDLFEIGDRVAKEGDPHQADAA